jgi:hypothetical protein
MWTCIVRVTGIMSMMSEGAGIQHACGQFEHAIDAVNLARERSPPPTSYKDGVSRASRSTLALWMPLIPTL